jgi:tRNA 2-thiouridine synthesizing protein A
MNIQRELDARGLNCPLPILRTKKMLAEMESGQVLRIVATDEGSLKDFPAFCRQTGNELLGAKEVPAADRKEFEFLVMRK